MTDTYSLKMIVCRNTETLGEGEGLDDEVCEQLASDLSTELYKLPFVEDVDYDRHFPNWHGGKYSHQAAAYGYKTFGWTACVCVVHRGLGYDEDGEEIETEERVRWSALPEELRAEYQEKIFAAYEAAYEVARKWQAEIDAERAAVEN